MAGFVNMVMNFWEFVERLSSHKLIKKDPMFWSYLGAAADVVTEVPLNYRSKVFLQWDVGETLRLLGDLCTNFRK
jgi:hypothetical protein